MNVRVLALVSLFCLIAGSAHGEARLWTYDTKDPILDYQQSPLGNLIVTCFGSIVAVDPETGSVQWRREDLRPGYVGLTMFPLTPFAAVQEDDDLTVIDLGTGRTLWDASVLPFKDVWGHLAVPELGAFLIFGKSGGSDGSVALVDAATGEARWQANGLLEGKPEIETEGDFERDFTVAPRVRSMIRHQPVVVHDGGIVFYVSKDGLMKVDATSGRPLWKVKKLKGKSPPMLGKGYAPFVMADDIIYVPYDRKLIAVNLTNGSIAWHHEKNFKSTIRQMEMSAEGLVVYGYKDAEIYTDVDLDKNNELKKSEKTAPAKDFFMEVFVPGTGVASWDHPFTEMDAPLPFFVDEDYAFLPRSQDVILVDLQQGNYSQFARLNLKNDEIPTHVERVGRDFLVASPQNMVLLKSRGGLRYHVYYEPPGATFWQKVLMITGGLVLDDIFDTDLEETRWRKWGPGELGSANRVFMQASLDAIAERFSLTTEGNRFRYIYTKEPLGDHKGYSLVKVDKATGEEAGRIWVDKQFPDYKIDLATETVFAREGTSKIFAVR